jgi:hypothetical protein
MYEQQSDDFFIPTSLLKLPRESITSRHKGSGNIWCETQTEDFLKGIQGWTEYFPIDECVE